MANNPTAAGYALAATHIAQAQQAAGLSNRAFADWLRVIAKDIETDGQRSLGEVRS
ncbi:hypothetical protein [Kaistia granuli]|uniref:hypothetical protein n=1 Tax=Kaistia granuli TaxID=363259 RepID=UPI0003A9B16D|nr:hypothetical protein [Kaistia granuli]